MSPTTSPLPCAEACERNKEPILAVLRQEFASIGSVLEIGSGTGQHAVHFAPRLPWLQWQPSERPGELGPLEAWLAAYPAPNLRLPPLAIDVRQGWPAGPFDAVFTANTLHIMDWESVGAFFRGVGAVLGPRGVLAVYGPFNYGGAFTSDSNRAFDGWLRARDPRSGIRDVEAVHALAAAEGLLPRADHAMPANNRLLVWGRV